MASETERAGLQSTRVVLFACVHNAGRSQMAAAFFHALCPPGRALALSAGTEPAAVVDPAVVAVMSEAGVDLGSARPKLLTAKLARIADLVVTMGCGEACPVVPGVRREDWPLDDPQGRSLAELRRIRNEIRERVAGLVAALA